MKETGLKSIFGAEGGLIHLCICGIHCVNSYCVDWNKRLILLGFARSEVSYLDGYSLLLAACVADRGQIDLYQYKRVWLPVLHKRIGASLFKKHILSMIERGYYTGGIESGVLTITPFGLRFYLEFEAWALEYYNEGGKASHFTRKIPKKVGRPPREK